MAESPRKCLFFDRDGVVNQAIDQPYVTRWSEFRYMPGIKEVLLAAKEAGYFTVLITNQQGVAKGLMTEAELEEIHGRMQRELGPGAFDGIKAATGGADDPRRKPSPTMILEAAEEWGIDLAQSWMVGDDDRDMQAAHAAGLRGIRLLGDKPVRAPSERQVSDHAELLRLIPKLDSTQRFSDRVANYVLYRPSYPPELVEICRREAALGQGSVFADIGSGTGLSSGLFLDAGYVVMGVEPNVEMRAAAEEKFAGHPHFHSVEGKAEATSLAAKSVDMVLAAQAFHWFDPAKARAEFERILRPGGKIVLVWNERLREATPFLRAYEDLLLRFGTDYREVRHENVDGRLLGEFYPLGYVAHVLANAQRFDFPGLRGRLLSSSYAPGPGHPRHEEMIQHLQAIFEQHQDGGQVSFLYETKVYVGD